MERQAAYVMVGVIFVTLLFGAFIFVVWLANFQFNRQYDIYRIIFTGPVSGLSRGGDVQLSGIKVGEITNLELDEHDANKVLTDIRVDKDTPVRTDSTAQAVALGITGVKYVQISPGSPNLPLLKDVSRSRPPIITARRARMEDFVNDLGKLARSGAEALRRVNRLLSDTNIQNVSQSFGHVRSVTGELDSRKMMFARMDSALTKLDSAATDLQTTLRSTRLALGSHDRGALSDVREAAAEFRGAAAEMRKVMAKMDGPVSELSTSTLPSITAAVDSVQGAADRLEGLAYELQQNPGSLLSKRPVKEVEIPQ